MKLPYPAIVAAICNVMQRLPRGTALLLDNTGIGRGVYDMLRHEGQSPIGVTIGSGDRVNWEGTRVTVPKAVLVSKLIALVHSGNLAIHGGLRDWPALKHEMEIFRPEITPSGKETWNAAGSGHDDLLTAAALCSWYIQHDDMSSWGVYEYARLQASHPTDTHEEFVCAVDIGQSADPTAIACMSRLDGGDPKRDVHFLPALPAQPESTVEPPDPLDPAWQDEQNEALKRSIPGRTGTGPLWPRNATRVPQDNRFHCLNGPEARTWAIGSQEHAAQQRDGKA